VLDGDPAPPHGKGHSPTFRPMSTVTKRSPISTNAKLLLTDDGVQKAIHHAPHRRTLPIVASREFSCCVDVNMCSFVLRIT